MARCLIPSSLANTKILRFASGPLSWIRKLLPSHVFAHSFSILKSFTVSGSLGIWPLYVADGAFDGVLLSQSYLHFISSACHVGCIYIWPGVSFDKTACSFIDCRACVTFISTVLPAWMWSFDRTSSFNCK